jgi:hypothetical protein
MLAVQKKASVVLSTAGKALATLQMPKICIAMIWIVIPPLQHAVKISHNAAHTSVLRIKYIKQMPKIYGVQALCVRKVLTTVYVVI